MRQRNRPTTPAPYRSAGSTRNLPLKYAKSKNEPYKDKAAVNASSSPKPTRMRNAMSALWRFTRKAFQSTTRLFISSPLDKKLQNRIHQGNRWSDEF